LSRKTSPSSAAHFVSSCDHNIASKGEVPLAVINELIREAILLLLTHDGTMVIWQREEEQSNGCTSLTDESFLPTPLTLSQLISCLIHHWARSPGTKSVCAMVWSCSKIFTIASVSNSQYFSRLSLIISLSSVETSCPFPSLWRMRRR
jgi:hypothetical protein